MTSARASARFRSSRRPTTRVVLTVVVALLIGWVGLASEGLVTAIGLTGCVAVIGSLVVAPRSRAVALVLLLLGTLPLAVLTWWSIITPVLAVLALLLGWPPRTRGRAAGPHIALPQPAGVGAP